MNDTSTKLLLKRKWTKIGKEEWQVVGEGKKGHWWTRKNQRTRLQVPIQSLTRLSFWSLERSEEYLPNIYQTLDLFSQYDVNKTKPPNNSETNSQTLNLPGRKPSIQRSQCSRHVKMSEMTYCHTLQWDNKQAKCITLPPWGRKRNSQTLRFQGSWDVIIERWKHKTKAGEGLQYGHDVGWGRSSNVTSPQSINLIKEFTLRKTNQAHLVKDSYEFWQGKALQKLVPLKKTNSPCSKLTRWQAKPEKNQTHKDKLKKQDKDSIKMRFLLF